MESGKESGVDGQRFAIGGRLVDADDPQLQDLLAQAYEAPGRPRCLCVAGGVEMYVAFHRHFQIKRMPETGPRHHLGCPSFEPEASQSGLGELIGQAVVEVEPGRVETNALRNLGSIAVEKRDGKTAETLAREGSAAEIVISSQFEPSSWLEVGA